MIAPWALGLLVWVTLYTAAWLVKQRCSSVTVSLGWCSITISTASFNRLFITTGRKHSSLLRQWYGLGTIAAGMLGVSACLIFLQELWRACGWLLQEASPGAKDGQAPGQAWAVGLALPGVTVPWGHSIFLWLATATSLAVHEAGHALAAAAEGVGMHHAACFLVLLLPGAYVMLDTDTLAVLGPLRALRVVCAGVWHNAVLCCACWLLAFCLPWLLLPLYATGRGAVIRKLSDSSPLAPHLAPGDRVVSIDGCPVRTTADWLACLMRPPGAHLGAAGPAASQERQSRASALEHMLHQSTRLPGPTLAGSGYCVPQAECSGAPACTPGAEPDACAAGELCFVELSGKLRDAGPSPLAGGAGGASGQEGGGRSSGSAARWAGGAQGPGLDAGARREAAEGVCLSARRAVAHRACGSSRDDERGGGGCGGDAACLAPDLLQGERLFKVCYEGRSGSGSGVDGGQRHGVKPVPGEAKAQLPEQQEGGAACPQQLIFVGSQEALLHAAEVTDYAARGWAPVLARRLAAGAPHALEQLLAYTFAVSAALALLNAAPVFCLDGAAALDALLGLHGGPELACAVQGAGARRWRRRMRTGLLCAGTATFGAVLALHAARLAGAGPALHRCAAWARHAAAFAHSRG